MSLLFNADELTSILKPIINPYCTLERNALTALILLTLSAGNKSSIYAKIVKMKCIIQRETSAHVCISANHSVEHKIQFSKI